MAFSLAPYLNRIGRVEIAGLPVGKMLLLETALATTGGLVEALKKVVPGGEQAGVDVSALISGGGLAVAFDKIRQVGEILGEDMKNALVLASLVQAADQSIDLQKKIRHYVDEGLKRIGLVKEESGGEERPTATEPHEGAPIGEIEAPPAVEEVGVTEIPSPTESIRRRIASINLPPRT